MTNTTKQAVNRIKGYLGELERLSGKHKSTIDPDHIHGFGNDHVLKASDIRALLAERDEARGPA